MVGSAVIYQRNVRRTVREHLVIHFQAGNAATNRGMILHEHFIPGRVCLLYTSDAADE